jgi:acyl dehydratase
MNQAGEIAMTQETSFMVARRKTAIPPGSWSATGKPRREIRSEPNEAAASERVPAFAFHYEDFLIGQKREVGAETFTKESILRFARAYDPQVFHVDEEAAKQSHFGGLVASGWHIVACWMKHHLNHYSKIAAEYVEQGGTLAERGPSPGFRNMKWRYPVYAGDMIRYFGETVDKRPTSRPGWGLVFGHNKGFNQDGILVFEFQSAAFFRMRT